MKKAISIIAIFTIIRFIRVSSNSCKDNPSRTQCLAINNRFLLPRNSSCNPFLAPCRMGDLVDTKVATCTLRYSGHVQHSLESNYRIPSLYRCSPTVESEELGIKNRIVSADSGEPRCTPVEKSGEGVFTCGEKGTRCVCDSPEGVAKWTMNKCRCQYFIDFCAISKVCRDPNAECTTLENVVVCTCPAAASNKTSCSLGINQCATDASLCSDQNAQCIELYDRMSSWNMAGEKSDDGYACVNVDDIKLLKRSTQYCSVSSEKLTANAKASNHIDHCCFRQLICDSADKTIKGNIMSYRPCYCNSEFRTCLTRYRQVSVYRHLARAALNALNQLRTCEIDEGTLCNPKKPKTCKKGDFIDPKLAHCRINCKTGPLLAIGKRMCRIRQCSPPNHVEGVRIIDVPDSKTSSICEAVRHVPYLCGRGDTRCVCDGRPTGLAFTDRCRCQFWPLEI